MRFFKYIFCLVLLLGFVSCGSKENFVQNSSGAKLQIVTTIAPLYSMTVNVAGEYAEVTNLVPIGASEHMYQPRPSDVMLLSTADVVIKNGLELETFLNPLLESSVSESRIVVDTSEGIPLLSGGDHKHTADTSEHSGIDDHEHHEEVHQEVSHGDSISKGDPHIWLSIANAKIQVHTIEQALIQKAPEHAEDFRKNAQAYTARLDELAKDLQVQMATVSKQPYILFHDGFQYFEREFGLQSAGVVQEFPGKEPSVQYMAELYEIIESKGVRVAFTEPQFSPRTIEQLKNRFQLVTAELDTIGDTMGKEGYERLMQNNVRAFTEAFSKSSQL